MNTDKTMYWVALGVLALGLHSEYSNGSFSAIHRVAGQAESTLCRLVTRAERTLATARILVASVPQEVRVDDDLVAPQRAQVERLIEDHQEDLDRALADRQAHLDRAMALRQSNLDCLQQKLDRMHVALDRAQVQRARALERMQFQLRNAVNRRTVVVCPRTGTRITVHADANLSDVDMNFPAIDVGDSF